MDRLPRDPAILVSSVNMLLRDGEFDSLDEICLCFGREPAEIRSLLAGSGYVYSETQRQVRPAGFDKG